MLINIILCLNSLTKILVHIFKFYKLIILLLKILFQKTKKVFESNEKIRYWKFGWSVISLVFLLVGHSKVKTMFCWKHFIVGQLHWISSSHYCIIIYFHYTSITYCYDILKIKNLFIISYKIISQIWCKIFLYFQSPSVQTHNMLCKTGSNVLNFILQFNALNLQHLLHLRPPLHNQQFCLITTLGL